MHSLLRHFVAMRSSAIGPHTQRYAVSLLVTVLIVAGSGRPVTADQIGSVDTRFRFLTPDDSIRVDVFDDPKIAGVSCYISRAQTGGVSGAMGLAEDSSEASIDCRLTGPVKLKKSIKNGERVFTERRSLIFKQLQVVRYCDAKRNVLVYLAYSDRVIEGSPQNSVSSVPLFQSSPRQHCKDFGA